MSVDTEAKVDITVVLRGGDFRIDGTATLDVLNSIGQSIQEGKNDDLVTLPGRDESKDIFAFRVGDILSIVYSKEDMIAAGVTE